jgi:hypothetical protein
MEHGQELLALILPPQGRLAVAASDSAGLLPGPGLMLALEHKGPAGSQTVAGLLDRQRVLALQQTLGEWLAATGQQPATVSPAHVVERREDGAVEVVDSSTVATWLASGAEGMDL